MHWNYPCLTKYSWCATHLWEAASRVDNEKVSAKHYRAGVFYDISTELTDKTSVEIINSETT